MTIYPPTDPRAYIDDCDCEDCRLQRADKLVAAAQEFLTRQWELNSWLAACKEAGDRLNRRSWDFVDMDVDYHTRQGKALKALVDLTGWGPPPDATVPSSMLIKSKYAPASSEKD